MVGTGATHRSVPGHPCSSTNPRRVALAAGFTGYFKFRERSFNLQQTADAIEREYESVELRVGRYAGMTETQAYAAFTDIIERLRDNRSSASSNDEYVLAMVSGYEPALTCGKGRPC